MYFLSRANQMTSSTEDMEYTPFIEKRNHDTQPSFSTVRARIVSVVIPVLALSAGSARDTLMAQYIVSKLTAERGLALNETDKAPCNVELNDSRAHEADLVEAETSEFLAKLSFAMCGPAFIICVLVGSYSDFIGRRLVLMMSVLAYLLRMVITAVIVKFDLDLNYLYLAYGIEGMGGSWFVMLVGLYSLTADINTTKHDRTFWINFIICSTTVNTAGANVAVGYLIGSVGYFYACLLLVSMVCIAFFVVVFTLPETLPVHKRPKAIGKNPLLYVRRVASFYVFDGPLRRRATFCVCLLVFSIGVASEINIDSMDALYLLRRPFCWGSSRIGNYVAIRSAGTAFLGTLVFKLMQCCLAEEKIGMMAILFLGMALTFEAFIQVDWYFYLVPVILIPEVPFSSIVRSLMSMLAGPDKQGAVFSSIAIVETLSTLLSTTSFNKIFAATVSYMPGAVYLVMASCAYVAFILFGVYFCIREPPSRGYDLLVNSDDEMKEQLDIILIVWCNQCKGGNKKVLELQNEKIFKKKISCKMFFFIAGIIELSNSFIFKLFLY
ncbi:hypothetical protein Btru_042068 [Bulinus truncatus]|nr:hypothetical protein Btru_042068 [Bulinus truncatus]